MQRDTRKIIADVAVFALSQVAFFYAFKYVMSSLDPNQPKRKDAKVKSEKVLGRLGMKDVQLTEHEEIIAAEVVHPDDIDVNFKDIGGLEPIISTLRESVIFPLCYPDLFNSPSNLLGAPKGVLLYGPPGCGKTMLAKALAKESGATFINMHVSTLTDKWFGESNKLISGLFSLARKLQPSIIFIDEIDSFLRERGRGDHEVTALMKSEMLTLWDGLTSGTDRIMVLGATNRPNDIDQAVLRRMPKRFAVKLPDREQRKKILSLMLDGVNVAPDFDMGTIVLQTEGCSGSDLKEICRSAAMQPIREVLREKGGSAAEMEKAKAEGFNVRPLANSDFFVGDASTPMVIANGSSVYHPTEPLD